ncbi:MAG: EAL domain-containing protein [Microbacteriaceae bacterium]
MTGSAGNPLFQLAIEQGPEAIVIVDAHGIIAFTNARFHDLLGYRADEVLGKPLTMLLPERSRSKHTDLVAGFFRHPRLRVAEPGLPLTMLHRDGTEHAVEIALSPLNDGERTMGMATIRAVSEHRQYQLAALHDAARLADAQEMAHVGSYEIDTVTGQRWWSDEFWRLFGLEPGSRPAIRATTYALTHADDRGRLEELWAQVERGENPPDFDYRIIQPSGAVRWVRTRARYEPRGRTGNPTIIGMTMDITDLREAYRRRYQAERNFELGFDRSPIGIAMLDVGGTITRVNRAFCHVVGREADELIDTVAADLLAPIDDPGDVAAYQEMVAGTVDDFQVQRLVMRPRGESVWVDEMITRVRDEHGVPAYYFLQLQDISSRKNTEATLMRQAFHDALTGLPNRLMLTRRIEKALDTARQSGNRAAILFLDVDEFKPVNDSFGHDAGDLLLVMLAQRLGGVMRGSDMLARFGGDELVVVCDRMTEESAAQLADRITDVTREPFVLGGQDVHISVSIGITLATGYEDVAAVLRSSDAAMFEAKQRRRPVSARTVKAPRPLPPSQSELETALNGALDRGELRVVYQPIVTFSSTKPVAFEALLRWRHPQLGSVSPLRFIPVAERSRLIVPIGEWVLRQALGQTHQWREELPGQRDLGISVNVSAVQMQDAGFVPVVESIVDEVGIDPAAIQLELTESIVMNDIEKACGGLQSLRSVGVRVAIDDFGTGYSSLAYLRDLPANAIKIDRSFVTPLENNDPSALPILRAIIVLAEGLGLDTVAEGVETVRQRNKLRELGVDVGQGYLWSKALPAEDVPAWLAGLRSETPD